MDRDNDTKLDALLQATIDAYGGNPERWPPARRDELGDYAQANPDAAHRVDEAAALDRLLNQSASAAHRDIPLRLVTDIMSKATRMSVDRAEDHRSAQVVRLEPARHAATGTRPKLPVRRSNAGVWQAAAMLAASLLLGVFIGGTGQLNTTVAQLDAYLGGSASTEIAILLPHPIANDGEYAGEDPL